MENDKPTVVLVHGAFADSSGFDVIVRRLVADGYPVVAAESVAWAFVRRGGAPGVAGRR